MFEKIKNALGILEVDKSIEEEFFVPHRHPLQLPHEVHHPLVMLGFDRTYPEDFTFAIYVDDSCYTADLHDTMRYVEEVLKIPNSDATINAVCSYGISLANIETGEVRALPPFHIILKAFGLDGTEQELGRFFRISNIDPEQIENT